MVRILPIISSPIGLTPPLPLWAAQNDLVRADINFYKIYRANFLLLLIASKETTAMTTNPITIVW
jgi:hypothetical protein